MDYITCQYEPTGVFSKKCFRSHDDILIVMMKKAKYPLDNL